MYDPPWGIAHPLRRLSVATAVLISTVVFGQRSEAQVLTFSLFERYLDSFRVEAGIPGMSATILQNGVVLWERGFGRRDVEAGLAATPDTPYLIGGLSQIFGSTMLLRKCVDQGALDLDDAVSQWVPLYPEPQTTVRQLLTHTSPAGTYQYAPGRFASLTGVIEACADVPYRMLVSVEIFERFAMLDSAPDQVLATPTAQDRDWFDGDRLARYAQVISRLATPYRVVNGRAQRNPDGQLPRRADTSDGIISSVRDLARFDSVLGSTALLAPETRNLAWTQAFAGTTPLPTGLGWFVQNYNGEPLVWQFGLIRGSHSSLILKAPNRGLTLILLANSDGLNAPFALEGGDVTTSLFASLFLRLFVP